MGRSRSRSRFQRLIDERQQYRRDRDFAKADRIRDELRDMGVQVDDAASTWTGPGGLEGRYGGGGGGRGGGGGGGFGGGGGGGRVDVDRIQRLVDERQQYRRDRDFSTADRMRDELRDMGVQVSDDSLTWRGPGGLDGVVNNGGGGGGRGRGRSRSRSRGRGGGYGDPPGGGYGFGMPPAGFGGPPGYGMPPPGYGGCGMPPCGGGFGMPPPGYGGPPPLPPGWEQANDPASGRPYFCNRSTGESSWTPPPAPAGGPGGYGGGPGPGGPGGPGGSPPLPQGWEQAPDPKSGKPYYFNRATGETRWEPP
ncbi:unnamed protein product [Prorocentrum cordatum]|uniref:WW domain-containing protein n=1 Tax=Prorocentrum cordatum TaxID=2364126 RepID=A0ABN9R7E9_9DINO|nr:unnamed protein product [Polarella glacialis]